MSKVFEGADPVRRDAVYLMIDTSLAQFEPWQRRPPSETAFDERLALAVEIGLSAQNEGFTLAALATGHEWMKLDNLLSFYQQIASCKALHRNTQADKIFPQAVGADDGVHILVIGRWGVDVENLVTQWQQAGILVLVFMLPESPADIGMLPIDRNFTEVQRRCP